jgi:hypothetical protein
VIAPELSLLSFIMQDLSSISKALHEVIDSPGKLLRLCRSLRSAEHTAPDEEKLTSTIERFLLSNDPAVRVAAVRTLTEILAELETSRTEDGDRDAKLVSYSIVIIVLS